MAEEEDCSPPLNPVMKLPAAVAAAAPAGLLVVCPAGCCAAWRPLKLAAPPALCVDAAAAATIAASTAAAGVAMPSEGRPGAQAGVVLCCMWGPLLSGRFMPAPLWVLPAGELRAGSRERVWAANTFRSVPEAPA